MYSGCHIVSRGTLILPSPAPMAFCHLGDPLGSLVADIVHCICISVSHRIVNSLRAGSKRDICLYCLCCQAPNKCLVCF